jgi:nucleoside-diphosphate-sugar epimerase
MRIGIVGCGYVGQAAATHWKQMGHHVAVTTRHSDRIPFLKTLADQVYLLGTQSLDAFIAQQEALLICVAPDAVSDYTSTYLHTAKQVAEQTKWSSTLQHILYTSSTSIYGDHAGAWVDESTLLKPVHENAKILSETEQILLSCASTHLKVCIFRLAEIYGPGREIENRLRRMQPQSFPGTGDSYTNLIHLTDIVLALDFALQHGLNGIYNLCNDFHIPRHLFYDWLCEKEQMTAIKWDPTRTHSHQGNRRVSNQKLKSAGYVFSHPTY